MPKYTKRIYKCNECLGKLCGIHMIMKTEVEFDYKTIKCSEDKPKPSWTWIASINVKLKNIRLF